MFHILKRLLFHESVMHDVYKILGQGNILSGTRQFSSIYLDAFHFHFSYWFLSSLILFVSFFFSLSLTLQFQKNGKFFSKYLQAILKNSMIKNRFSSSSSFAFHKFQKISQTNLSVHLIFNGWCVRDWESVFKVQ